MGTAVWLARPGPPGPPGPPGVPGLDANVRRFVGSAVSGNSGTVTFDMSSAGFTVPPAASACVVAADGSTIYDVKITALTKTSCSVRVRSSNPVSILGVSALGLPAPCQGVSVNLIAIQS